MWDRKKFDDAAQSIGDAFVASGGDTPINDLATKVAQEGNLNPDGIRTVVRLANVAAFEGLFAKCAAEGSPERMIEFSVGDPEIVIQKLHQDVKEAHAIEKVAQYNQQADYFGDIERERAPLEKTATVIPGVERQSEACKPTAPSKSELNHLFKRAEDQMQENKRQAEIQWGMSCEKVARHLIALDSRVESRTAFEKNAASSLGETILPELRMVQSLTSPKGAPIQLFGGEKTASVIDKHIAGLSSEHRPIMELLKEANAARAKVNSMKTGLKWLEERKAEV